MILPLHLDMRGSAPLVVGGGARAARWVYLLIEAGAKPRICAETLDFELRGLAKAKEFTWHRRKPRPSDFAAAKLVVAASEDSTLNRRVLREALARKLWVVSADAKQAGNAWLPQALRRGGLLIHFGLPGGPRPGPSDEELGAYLRRRLSRAFGREWELVWAELKGLRRRLPLRKLLPGWLKAARRGGIQKIRRDLEKMIRARPE